MLSMPWWPWLYLAETQTRDGTGDRGGYLNIKTMLEGDQDGLEKLAGL